MAYAVVTGASGGIGEAMCEELARHGHDLVMVARSEGKLQTLASRLSGSYGIDARIVPLDLSAEGSCETLHDTTNAASLEVDALVNNAGFGDHAAFLDTDWDHQEQMVRLNLLALMHLTQLYGRDMRDAGYGRILNLSSVAAFCAGPYMSIYYATKGFVLQFSQAVHEELAGTGVTCTALCPGPTATGFANAAGGMAGSKMFSFMGAQGTDAVAKRGYAAMMAGKPVAYHSPATYLVNVGSRLAPRTLAAKVAGIIDGKPREKASR